MSISEFRSNIFARNVSRPYLFYVNILPPPNMSEGLEPGKLVSMFCHGANTPATNLYTTDDYTENGIRRSVVYDYAYQNLTLDFYVDINYEVRNFFDVWMTKIVGNRRNFEYQENYTANLLELNMISLASDGAGGNAKTYKYTFNRVFPKSVNSINLSSGSIGQASTFTVDFTFETFSYSKSETSTKANTAVDPIKVGITNTERIANLTQTTA